MAVEKQNFEMYSGDTKNIIINVTDSDGSPLSLDGATVVWVLKPKVYSEEVTVAKRTGDGINTDSNKIKIRLDPDDTESLSGLYYHEAEVTDAKGNVSTVTTGYIKIKMDGV